jgi:hypothetical protein
VDEPTVVPDRHTGFGNHGSSLRDLPRLRGGKRRRESCWDRSGGNRDFVVIEPGETATLCDISGAGSINHIWMTAAVLGEPLVDPDVSGLRLPRLDDEKLLRSLVLRMYWDHCDHSSVLTPLGDFFGVGHGRTTNFSSMPLQMSPENGLALNSFFHMPFETGARIEIQNEMEEEDVHLCFYVDYESFDALGDGLGRFHASWHRENPTEGTSSTDESNLAFLLNGTNVDGQENYVILDAEGTGHYVGCVLNVLSLRDTVEEDWYGEGDDMIFIDGEKFPPTLHGTGTEDYFNTAWCPTQTYSAPYHGVTLPGGANWSGPVSLYRFHVEDPIMFETSIRVTIEHGHANKRSDDVSSTAYWYQTLPHKPLSLLPVHERLSKTR